MIIKDLFKIESSPRRGLLPLEWAVLGYMTFTLLMVLFTFTRLDNPDSMIWDRLKVGVMTAALWASYRLLPCRLVMFIRVMAQFALLAWWYPDTYELNRVLPNLDHYFALADQWLFGYQPALAFAARFPSCVVSELMDMGYAAYYPMIALTALYFFFYRYKDFQQTSFVLIASFFAYYVVFDLVPVVGPTFYYKAVGLNDIARGVFPNVHDYFNTHQACLPSPGYRDGVFYHLVENAKAAGERPTAAFPSSHVGISTVCMLLVGWARNHRLFLLMTPFYVLLCLATVYIQAHYAVDAIAGLLTGALAFWGFMKIYPKTCSNSPKKRAR